MSTLTLVAMINRAGWLVTELYQRHHDQWFAALRKRGEFTSAQGEGDTMDKALEEAWLVAQKHRRMSAADWEEVRNPSSRPTRPKKVERFSIKRNK